MSIIFFICFLLSATSSVLSVHDDDERALLKMKKQLGDPDVLQRWVKGYNFCQPKSFDAMFSGAPVYTGCSSTGRVDTLFLFNIYNVTAPFPDAICDLTELEHLRIFRFPELYGEIPSCMTKLMNLFIISIQITSLSGPVPSFYNQTKLRDIILEYSHLSGTIPQSLSTLPNLDWLHLTWNNLTGTIPPGLFHTDHPSLILSKNNLSGEIPKCYGRVDFAELDVSDNRLSGDASFLFSKDKSYDIILANNEFEFDLSSVEISGRDTYLLNISHNKIFGKVPDSFANPDRLFYTRDLSNNRLCGELPAYNGFEPQDVANNLCLCGDPLPPCPSSSFAPPPF